jgi:hypothetical protein
VSCGLVGWWPLLACARGAAKEVREYERLYPSKLAGKKRGDMELCAMQDILGSMTSATDRGVVPCQQLDVFACMNHGHVNAWMHVTAVDGCSLAHFSNAEFMLAFACDFRQ